VVEDEYRALSHHLEVVASALFNGKGGDINRGNNIICLSLRNKGGFVMPKYMIQATTTPQAAAGVLQKQEDRTKVIRPIFEAIGGSLEQYYISLDSNTLFLIVDVPDQASLSALTLAFFAGGQWASFQTTPIITASEAVNLFKKAANVSYKPPGR